MYALVHAVLAAHGHKAAPRHQSWDWRIFLLGTIGGVAGGCWNIYRALDQREDASLWVLIRLMWKQSGLLILMAGLGGLGAVLISIIGASATAVISGLGFWGIFTMFTRTRTVKREGKARDSDEDEYAHR